MPRTLRFAPACAFFFAVEGAFGFHEYFACCSGTPLAEWVGRVGVALQPLVDRLSVLLRERSVLHADETPLPQLDPGKGKTKKAYLWAYRSNDLEPGPPILVFDYQPGRHRVPARNFLEGWQGHLMVDDFAGYKALFTQSVTELARLAHAAGSSTISMRPTRA